VTSNKQQGKKALRKLRMHLKQTKQVSLMI